MRYLVLAAMLLPGCSMALGNHDLDAFESYRAAWNLPTVRIHVCTNAPEMVERSIPDYYGIRIHAVMVPTTPRGGFTDGAIYTAVWDAWDHMACDRLMMVYEPTGADLAMWALLGGIRGAVGYNERGQAVGYAFTVPDVLEHEMLHVLGCRTHEMIECYAHLAKIKRREVK